MKCQTAEDGGEPPVVMDIGPCNQSLAQSGHLTEAALIAEFISYVSYWHLVILTL